MLGSLRFFLYLDSLFLCVSSLKDLSSCMAQVSEVHRGI